VNDSMSDIMSSPKPPRPRVTSRRNREIDMTVILNGVKNIDRLTGCKTADPSASPHQDDKAMQSLGREDKRAAAWVSRWLRDSSFVRWGFILSLAMWPSSALAHEQAGAAAGFLTGLAHPISGLDHVIAMVAVGLWGAQLGAPAMFLLPVAFPMVMAIGGMLGLIGVSLPGIEIGIAVSAVVLGAVVLASAQPRVWVALVIVGLFAVFHGHAHGTELPPGQSGLFYSIGFVAATGILHAFGILLGLVHRWPIGRLALRAAGALVSIAGMAFLWRAVS
jgi:urease accessory protein